MSQPIRYGLADEHLGRIHPQADGHLVMWSDYAALAAENDRLRKAGDAVAYCLEAYWKGKPYDVETTIKCFDAWNAAKEGRDAK